MIYYILRRVTVIALSVIIIWWCNFGSKSHPKQKCFDDSCIPFCIGKQAADLSQLIFLNWIAKKIQIKSQIEMQSFESNLYSLNWISKDAQIANPNCDWDLPITGCYANAGTSHDPVSCVYVCKSQVGLLLKQLYKWSWFWHVSYFRPIFHCVVTNFRYLQK